MSQRYVYTIKVARTRNGGKYWSAIGTLFFNPETPDHPESIGLRFNSLPAIGDECRAFPKDEGQPPAPANGLGRYNLTIKLPGRERSYFHTIGTAFYNEPRGDYSDNFNLLLDSYPLTGEVTGYIPRDRDEQDAEEAA